MATPASDPDHVADAERIAQRYPRRRTHRGWLLVLIVVMTALVTWSVWAGIRHAAVGMSAELYGYQVVSPNQIDVTLTVYRPDPSRPGTCTLTAQARSGQVVGELTVNVPPASTREVRLQASIRTVAEPVTATIGSCRLA